jgi:predicted nucleotide-binding protein
VSEEQFLSTAHDFPEIWKNMSKMLVSRLRSTSESLPPPKSPCVFIGHGRSKLWGRLQLFLQDELGLQTVTYEKEARAGLSIVQILERMLRQATFAVLVLTGEDETAEGGKRARQNVIHEAGLFQGVLGFQRAVMLVQKGAEEFSNVAGLQYIEFEKNKIENCFWELQRVLKREGILKT